MDADNLFSRQIKEAKASEIREMLKVVKSRDIISFGGGMPDPCLFPVEDIKRITADVLSERGALALQYETTEGYDRLCRKLSGFMSSGGMKVSPDEILITAGSQQALDMFGRAFIDPGDEIILEEPTYLAAWSAFRTLRPKVILAPMDCYGLKPDALREILRERRSANGGSPGRRIKFLYTVPTCQNPTGITLTEERRRALVEIAEEFDFLIIEDDPYGYLSDEPNPPFIKAIDGGRTIYTSTFSKILAPGLRLGWIAAPEEILTKLAILKQSLDLCSCTLSQHIAYEFMERGLLERYISKLKVAYKTKRAEMFAALEEHFPENSTWTKPTGGMFIWAAVPRKVDTRALLPRAVENGVAYVPGAAFYPSGGGTNTMRINYSYPTREQIAEGVKRLGQVIREAG